MSDLGSGPRHLSVLANEVLTHLSPGPGQTVVDCTTGAGGHARLIAERLVPDGRLLALDRDAAMLRLARPRLEGLPVTLVQAGFDELPRVLREHGLGRVDGVLADIGICSDQLDDPSRGFTFSTDGPLDMRMNTDEGEPACDLIRRLNERELADIIFRYGEERFSRRIAKRIVETRRKVAIDTTAQLADLVRSCVPRPRRHPGQKSPIDTATRTFQALRIAVNDELRALSGLLQELPNCLKPHGRAVLISFHSLEDRQVKQAFRQRDIWEELTRKPITATEEETASNPRSRSAKLRAARLIDSSSGGSKDQ